MIATGLVICAFAIFTMSNTQSTASTQAPVAPAHVSNSFHFLVHAPLGSAAPLFGPEGERSWAGDEWNPQFLYPQPGKDIQGAVFTIQRGGRKSVWITTLFDVANGRMQYVSFVPDVQGIYSRCATYVSQSFDHEGGSDVCSNGAGCLGKCGSASAGAKRPPRR